MSQFGTQQDQSTTEPQKSRSIKSKDVIFVNIDEEEERDKEALNECMRKYQKLWRNIFAKYQNQGYKTTQVNISTYDKEKSKVPQLNFAEIFKLLKDHGAYP